MDKKTISKTRIFSEFSEAQRKDFFDFKKSSFINHVDTLYFVVYPDVKDWRTDSRVIDFISYLKSKKYRADTDRASQPVYDDIFNGLEVRPWCGFQMYSLHFGLQDAFDVFICEAVPNVKTPPIFVQLRSQYLWLYGIEKSIDSACDCVQRVLNLYGIDILRIQENRVDYAFHTNYIQDMINFFPEHKLSQMQVSNFQRWHKEGYFYQDNVFSDYFTLGRRKSNNVFFRCYNKCKEVIEMGYKQFFIPIWYDNGLISKFDKYVLEKAFCYGTYASKEKARCLFYCEYGSNKEIKLGIEEMFKDVDTPISSYKKYADKLVPDITIITNIEFQTKRKLYDRLAMPRVTTDKSYKANLYNVFEQMPNIISFLTLDTLRFVKYKGRYMFESRTERPLADWWCRLRTSKSLEIESDWLIDYYRNYQHGLDADRQKSLSIKKMAGMGAYLNGDKDECFFMKDIYDFISTLNDNDMKKYYTEREKKVKDIKKRGLL